MTSETFESVLRNLGSYRAGTDFEACCSPSPTAGSPTTSGAVHAGARSAWTRPSTRPTGAGATLPGASAVAGPRRRCWPPSGGPRWPAPSGGSRPTSRVLALRVLGGLSAVQAAGARQVGGCGAGRPAPGAALAPRADGGDGRMTEPREDEPMGPDDDLAQLAGLDLALDELAAGRDAPAERAGGEAAALATLAAELREAVPDPLPGAAERGRAAFLAAAADRGRVAAPLAAGAAGRRGRRAGRAGGPAGGGRAGPAGGGLWPVRELGQAARDASPTTRSTGPMRLNTAATYIQAGKDAGEEGREDMADQAEERIEGRPGGPGGRRRAVGRGRAGAGQPSAAPGRGAGAPEGRRRPLGLGVGVRVRARRRTLRLRGRRRSVGRRPFRPRRRLRVRVRLGAARRVGVGVVRVQAVGVRR